MLGVGVAIAVLTQRKRTRAAFFLFVLSMFVVICAVSLILDVPTAQTARSTHQFLLVLAIASLFFLRDDTALLRYGVAGACCVAFVILASSRVAISSDYVLPDGLQTWGPWVNNSFSALAACRTFQT